MQPASPEAYRLLHDGSIALADIEHNGIRIDTDYLSNARKNIRRKIKERSEDMKRDPVFKQWRKVYGDKTNLGSGAQLAHMLFNVLGYPNPNEGKLRSDEDTLSTIDLPFVRKYQSLEKMKKAEGTFLAGIERETVDGYLRPSFNLHIARTFRSSSDSPNFQNLPIRNPKMSKLIRRCFIPRDGNVLIEVDYGGIEVRVAACYNKDPVLISYIKDPSKDMHRDMAAECYMCKPEEVSKEMRYCAKNMFVFPQFYGSYFGDCAPSLWNAIDKMNLKVGDTSVREWLNGKGIKKLGDKESNWDTGRIVTKKGTYFEHIRKIEEHFWGERFKVYAEWKRRWFNQYLRRGGFKTLTGFVIEGIYNRNDVINYPVQGSAFHCLLWSLIRLLKEIRKRKMRAKVVGQIHDSIVADVPVSEMADYLALVKDIMIVQLPQTWDWINVPLEIEAEACPEGGSWYEKKGVSI